MSAVKTLPQDLELQLKTSEMCFVRWTGKSRDLCFGPMTELNNKLIQEANERLEQNAQRSLGLH